MKNSYLNFLVCVFSLLLLLFPVNIQAESGQWTVLPRPSLLSNDIEYHFGKESIFAVTNNLIFSSNDEGKNWSVIFQNDSIRVSRGSLKIISNDSLIYFNGFDEYSFSTTNGGKKWTKNRMPILKEMIVFDNNRLMGLTENGEVYISDTFGKYWAKHKIKKVNDQGETIEISKQFGYTGLYESKGASCVLSAYNHDSGFFDMFYSEDYGETYRIYYLSNPSNAQDMKDSVYRKWGSGHNIIEFWKVGKGKNDRIFSVFNKYNTSVIFYSIDSNNTAKVTLNLNFENYGARSKYFLYKMFLNSEIHKNELYVKGNYRTNHNDARKPKMNSFLFKYVRPVKSVKNQFTDISDYWASVLQDGLYDQSILYNNPPFPDYNDVNGEVGRYEDGYSLIRPQRIDNMLNTESLIKQSATFIKQKQAQDQRDRESYLKANSPKINAQPGALYKVVFDSGSYLDYKKSPFIVEKISMVGQDRMKVRIVQASLKEGKPIVHQGIKLIQGAEVVFGLNELQEVEK